MRLQGLGYEIERGKHGQPEIKGYTKEYLEAISPRREQIKDHLQRDGNRRSRRSAGRRAPNAGQQGAAVAGRGVAAASGAGRTVWPSGRPRGGAGAGACSTAPRLRTRPDSAQQAVTYARDHIFERSAVQDRRDDSESGARSRHG